MKGAPKRPDVRVSGDVVIISTHGYLDDDYGALVAKRFEEQFDKGMRKFLFNLAETKLTSTLGVSVLINILEDITSDSGVMAFCNCNTIVSTTFSIMGLKKYTKIYKSEEEALKEMA